MEARGIPPAVAQWLGTSLAPGGRSAAVNSNGSSGDQKLDWVFDIQGAAALYNSYRCAPKVILGQGARGFLAECTHDEAQSRSAQPEPKGTA